MSFAEKFVRSAQRVLPTPFTIAILLTIITVILALIFTESKTEQYHLTEILCYWEGMICENYINQGTVIFLFSQHYVKQGPTDFYI